MLQKDNRLRKIRDFNLLIKKGRWQNGNFFDLKYLELAKIREFFPKKEDPDTFEKQLKLAFSVGVKLSKSAVKRNRVRRLMREAVRLLMKEKKLRDGYYLMFVAKPGSMEKNFAEVSKEISLLISRARLMK